MCIRDRCYSQPVENAGLPGDIFGTPEDGVLPPGTTPTNVGFWGSEENAQEFRDQTETYTNFAENYCDENPDDPTCSQATLPPPQDGIIQDQDCDDNPYAPGCPQSGGQEGQGPPPEGEGIDCGDPSNSALPQCTNPGLYDPGEASSSDSDGNEPPAGYTEPPAGNEVPPAGPASEPPPVEEVPPAGPASEPPPGP